MTFTPLILAALPAFVTTTFVLVVLGAVAFVYAEHKYPKFVSEIVAEVESVYLKVETIVKSLFKKKAAPTPPVVATTTTTP